jgi:hypothetical protein
MRVRFDARTQADFFMSLGTEAKQLVETYQLSFSEAAAIVAYTNDSFFKAINHQFRSLKLDRIDITNPDFLINAGVENRDLAEVIAALVSGMRKLPPVQVDDSHFMALGRNVTMKKHELDLYKQDAEIVSPTFLSTTYSANAMISEKVGFWNAKDNAMFIYQRVNGNARDISAFSVYPGEKEILFLPNTKFKVLFRSEPEKTSRGADANELAEIEKKYHFEDKKTTFLSQIQDFVEQLINVAKPTAPVTKADDSLTKSFIVLQEIPYDSDPISSS